MCKYHEQCHNAQAPGLDFSLTDQFTLTCLWEVQAVLIIALGAVSNLPSMLHKVKKYWSMDTVWMNGNESSCEDGVYYIEALLSLQYAMKDIVQKATDCVDTVNHLWYYLPFIQPVGFVS